MSLRMVPNEDQYLKTKIETASPMQLIIIMYDGAIRFLKNAQVSYELRKRKQYDENLIRTKNILKELQLSLNFDAQPISNQLYSLYDYMLREISDAICNRKENIIKLKKVLHMLSELRSAWEQIIEKAPVEKEKRNLENISLSV
ncbi:MAG: flagellar export chaperone FliS [Candidatus Aureabacteria bacterium]|nr:flagellar export chaperone FliS [Candidatus Auribacterota bacterium]